MQNSENILWVRDVSRTPQSFLPATLDPDHLLDVSRAGDLWARFMDTRTGEIHDSGVYYAKYLGTDAQETGR